jgi:hypothetical protein
MKKFGLALLPALLLGTAIAMSVCSAARAGTLVVTITGADAESWTQSSNPTPITTGPGNFTEIAVTNGVATELNGSPYSATFSDVRYYNSSFSGGTQDSNFVINTYGIQLYGGTESAPTFVAGGRSKWQAPVLAQLTTSPLLLLLRFPNPPHGR